MDPKVFLSEICQQIALATSLQEGAPGIEAFLRAVYRNQPASPKDVARELGFPVPIISAIRREFEKRGLLERKGGIAIADDFRSQLFQIWGANPKNAESPDAKIIKLYPDIQSRPTDEKKKQSNRPPIKKASLDNLFEHCPTEDASHEATLFADALFPSDILNDEDLFVGDASLPDGFIPLGMLGDDEEDLEDSSFDIFEEILAERPKADRKWDQSHATLDTAIRRADFFITNGSIQGKRALFLGDDDMTALACMLCLRDRFGEEALRHSSAVVVEVDERLVRFITEKAMTEDLPIAVIHADLREGLPKPLIGQMDFFFCDPPYTPDGVALFLERGRQSLDPRGMGKGVLAVPLAPPDLQWASQESIHEMGFAIDFLIPHFNEYDGATMQGGVSALYGLTWLQQACEGKPLSPSPSIYTSQKKNKR